MADLAVKFAGINFKNPVLLASAEPTLNFEAMKKGIDQGIGGLIAKSYTDAESLRAMYKKPEMALLDEDHRRVMGKIPKMYTHISRTCFAKEELDEWLQILARIVRYGGEKDAVVIGSVAGTTVDSWVTLSKRVEETGVRMLELSFGCPHYGPEGQLGCPVGQNDEIAVNVVRAVKNHVSIPIIVKETPQLSNIVASVRKLREAGADAVTLTSRFLGLAINIDEERPYIHGFGGCGGPWVKPYSLRAISQVATSLDIPITGSNGVTNWKDALEFMMVGATTIQICTAAMVYGYKLLPKTLKGMSDWLDRKGYASVREIIGATNKHVLPYSEIVEVPKDRYEIDEDKCMQCRSCEDACFYGAFAWDGDQPEITDKCLGCGFCQSICPENAINRS